MQSSAAWGGGLRYSTGKTSLIKWVTGIESPFFDIRPQPSTDKFMAVVHGVEERAETRYEKSVESVERGVRSRAFSPFRLIRLWRKEKVINGDAASRLHCQPRHGRDLA